jgi:integration host factor subunit beta
MKEALKNGNRVEIRGFGSFKIKEYKGYQGRNPKTGEKVEVKPKSLPFFRAGKDLREYINS